tara:strand:- start:99 stop:569 length:471 start_codon:yes stop_codon:yes gene_type:complete
MGSVFGGQAGMEDVFDMDSNSASTFPGAFLKLALMGNPEARKFIEDHKNNKGNTDTFKAGLQQSGVELQAAEQQAAEAQATEQQGINQLNNIPPQIAQMLGAPQINPQQQAQQQQLQAQEESRQREAQNKASFGKDEEFENIMKALGNVNGLMQKG